MKKIHFETNKGEMVAELYDDDAPETVANFVGLATGEKEWTDPKTDQKNKGKPLFRRAALPSRGRRTSSSRAAIRSRATTT